MTRFLSRYPDGPVGIALVLLRLACAWPILIGMETLQRLRVEQVLNARPTIKVPRAEVRSVMVRSLLAYPFSSRWNALFRPGKPVASGRDMS